MNHFFKKISVLLVACALLGFSGCSRSNRDDTVTQVRTNDAAMNGAIATAKASSGEFIRAFHAHNPTTKDFYFKKPYGTPSGSQEHMWIKLVDESGGVLQGIVANEAEETREVAFGQKVSVNIADISDWKYQDGKKLVGGYTVRYFIEKMAPEEREAFLKEAGFEL